MQISQDAKTLDGSYWTDRATIGAMTFSRLSRDTSSIFEQAAFLASRSAAA